MYVLTHNTKVIQKVLQVIALQQKTARLLQESNPEHVLQELWE
jgi:hypothetical protein